MALELINGEIKETLQQANQAAMTLSAHVGSQYGQGMTTSTAKAYENAKQAAGLNQALNQFQNQTQADLSNLWNYNNGNGYYYPTYWHSYPVYITQDKTKKAIDILKKLEEEGLLEVKSVKKFISLVDQISKIL